MMSECVTGLLIEIGPSPNKDLDEGGDQFGEEGPNFNENSSFSIIELEEAMQPFTNHQRSMDSVELAYEVESPPNENVELLEDQEFDFDYPELNTSHILVGSPSADASDHLQIYEANSTDSSATQSRIDKQSPVKMLISECNSSIKFSTPNSSVSRPSSVDTEPFVNATSTIQSGECLVSLSDDAMERVLNEASVLADELSSMSVKLQLHYKNSAKKPTSDPVKQAVERILVKHKTKANSNQEQSLISMCLSSASKRNDSRASVGPRDLYTPIDNGTSRRSTPRTPEINDDNFLDILPKSDAAGDSVFLEDIKQSGRILRENRTAPQSPSKTDQDLAGQRLISSDIGVGSDVVQDTSLRKCTSLVDQLAEDIPAVEPVEIQVKVIEGICLSGKPTVILHKHDSYEEGIEHIIENRGKVKSSVPSTPKSTKLFLSPRGFPSPTSSRGKSPAVSAIIAEDQSPLRRSISPTSQNKLFEKLAGSTTISSMAKRRLNSDSSGSGSDSKSTNMKGGPTFRPVSRPPSASKLAPPTPKVETVKLSAASEQKVNTARRSLGGSFAKTAPSSAASSRPSSRHSIGFVREALPAKPVTSRKSLYTPPATASRTPSRRSLGPTNLSDGKTNRPFTNVPKSARASPVLGSSFRNPQRTFEVKPVVTKPDIKVKAPMVKPGLTQQQQKGGIQSQLLKNRTQSAMMVPAKAAPMKAVATTQSTSVSKPQGKSPKPIKPSVHRSSSASSLTQTDSNSGSGGKIETPPSDGDESGKMVTFVTPATPVQQPIASKIPTPFKSTAASFSSRLPTPKNIRPDSSKIPYAATSTPNRIPSTPQCDEGDKPMRNDTASKLRRRSDIPMLSYRASAPLSTDEKICGTDVASIGLSEPLYPDSNYDKQKYQTGSNSPRRVLHPLELNISDS